VQDKLDIKNRTRTNLLKWNAQFSPELIEHLLSRYSKPGDVVLDPFMGSGTVLVESARLGLSAIGTELNPAAVLLSNIYSLCKLNINEREDLISKIETLVQALLETPDLDGELMLETLNIKDASDNEAVVMKCLTVMTDISSDMSISKSKLEQSWIKIKKILKDIPHSQTELRVDKGDARNLNIADSSIDLVITSPPYINVFNYHQQYRKSVELLGYDVLDIAKSEIGANRKNRSNRFKTVISYCYEIKDVLLELSRVTKKNTRVVFIVGRQSNVMGTPFMNGEIVFRIATKHAGFKLIEKQERKFKNRFGQIIFEDILHFENTGKPQKTTMLKIVKSVLTDALSYTSKETTLKSLEEAIDYVSVFDETHEGTTQKHEAPNSSHRETEYSIRERQTA
jgi:DNA modification methylase